MEPDELKSMGLKELGTAEQITLFTLQLAESKYFFSLIFLLFGELETDG